MDVTQNVRGPFKLERIVTMMGEQEMHHVKVIGSIEKEGSGLSFPFIVSMVSDYDVDEVMSKAELELSDVKMRFGCS